MSRAVAIARRAGWVATLLALAAWLAFLRPTTLAGDHRYLIVSGNSMEPTMSDGDMSIVRRREAYAVGDVIAYRIPAGGVGAGTVVIHRVVAHDANGYVTQGDNRDGLDRWRPQDGDVLGTPVATIPFAGAAMRLLLTPFVLALATAAGVFARVSGLSLRRARRVPG